MHGLRHLEVEIRRGLTFLHHFVFSNVETGALAEDLEEKNWPQIERELRRIKIGTRFLLVVGLDVSQIFIIVILIIILMKEYHHLVAKCLRDVGE